MRSGVVRSLAVHGTPLVAIALAGFVLLGGACARDSSTAPDDATVTQSIDDGGAACTSTLDALLTTAWTACPATFSTDPQLLCGSSFPPTGLYEQSYGDLQSLWWDWGTHGIACFYDATGARVGLLQYDDVQTYCDRRSYSIRAGQTADLQFTAPRSLISCAVADGGT
jgi:hypothetical protein